jgi:hypothetical protein
MFYFVNGDKLGRPIYVPLLQVIWKKNDTNEIPASLTNEDETKIIQMGIIELKRYNASFRIYKVIDFLLYGNCRGRSET